MLIGFVLHLQLSFFSGNFRRRARQFSLALNAHPARKYCAGQVTVWRGGRTPDWESMILSFLAGINHR